MTIPKSGTLLRATFGILAALATAQASAAVRHVPGSHKTIQSAIDASAAGDTIRVAAGVYAEQLSIRKSIRIVGAGAGRTIVMDLRIDNCSA